VAIFDADKSLPTVGSLDNMKELLKDYGAEPRYMVKQMNGVQAQPAMKEKLSASVTSDSMAKSEASAPAPAAPPAVSAVSAQSEAKADYSGTNVQVQGVDEADIIKTDGTYIYQVNKNRVLITEAYPAEQMKVVQTVQFEDTNFRASELYIDGSYMVVIGGTSYPYNDRAYPAADSVPVQAAPAVESTSKQAAVQKIRILPIRPFKSTTKAIVYELGDRTNLKKIREVELEGNYVSSRKIGSSLYLAANKGLNMYPLLRSDVSAEEQQAAAADSLPSYRDTAAGSDSFVTIGYEDIRYFPKSLQPNYLLVAGLNLDQPEQKMDVSSYLGSGNQVYASQSQLYVTTEEYTPAEASQPADGAASIRFMPGQSDSVIYKFGMDQGKIRYLGRGKVPGRTLNQFSMDEHNGYFRIATTTGFAGMDGQFTSKNNMYILDEAMSITGKIEDIAPGEQIYSVRYAGGKAYMVTFRTVDPLFVLDLSDPVQPKILGKLKIPGYSNYLHPYDENHLIGFGKDAAEVTNGYAPDGTPNTMAYYQGMKMALFDVSDVANPKELYSEMIGDRGTESELLNNHKALLFSKEKNLLAFPVTVREMATTSSNKAKAVTGYGDFAFQGAYVYKLDLSSGFKLQGKITHLTDEDYLKAGQYMGLNERSIERILYIGDILYTTSQQKLKATDAATLQDVKTIELP
jgi:inhibitor of cysteine peptidase